MTENNRSGVWSYFDKVDRVNKEAECRLCHNVYKYKGTSHNLKLHLKHKHNDIFLRMPDSDLPETRKRANGTEVWSYFEPIDTEKKLASCNACRKSISYKTTTANLKTHLRLVHKEQHAEMMGEDECEEVYLEDEDSDSQGDAWSFFERCGAEARCAVCRAVVPKDQIRDHLRTRHPKLLEAESEEDTTNNTQEDVYTEIVFLENEENIKKTPKIEKVKKPRKPKTETIKRRLSSSSDEEPLKVKKMKNDDEIEQFGKYVTCLLKKVPQEVSMELQMDIVNLIMKKQLELKRKETPVLAATETKMEEMRTADTCQTVDHSFERTDNSFSNRYILNGENDSNNGRNGKN